jgi:hypothetical protein
MSDKEDNIGNKADTLSTKVTMVLNVPRKDKARFVHLANALKMKLTEWIYQACIEKADRDEKKNTK